MLEDWQWGDRHTSLARNKDFLLERGVIQEMMGGLPLELVSNPMDSYRNLGGERARNKNEKSGFQSCPH